MIFVPANSGPVDVDLIQVLGAAPAMTPKVLGTLARAAHGRSSGTIPVAARSPVRARYSLRSTSAGSNRAAARAGSIQARSVTAMRHDGTTTNVSGSVGFIPYSRLAANRVTPRATRRPSVVP